MRLPAPLQYCLSRDLYNASRIFKGGCIDDLPEFLMKLRMPALEIARNRLVGEKFRQVAARQYHVENIIAVGLFDDLEAALDERHLLFHPRDIAG